MCVCVCVCVCVCECVCVSVGLLPSLADRLSSHAQSDMGDAAASDNYLLIQGGGSCGPASSPPSPSSHTAHAPGRDRSGRRQTKRQQTQQALTVHEQMSEHGFELAPQRPAAGPASSGSYEQFSLHHAAQARVGGRGDSRLELGAEPGQHPRPTGAQEQVALVASAAAAVARTARMDIDSPPASAQGQREVVYPRTQTSKPSSFMKMSGNGLF